jgi:hypothetical protein
MVIDGCRIQEIEAKTAATKESEAVQALITFGDASNKDKTEWVDMKWKSPDKGWSPC